MTHTKGNWHLDPNVAKDYYPVYCDGIVIAEVGRRDHLEETRSNAQLIAAAPDLLKACQECLKVFDEAGIGANFLNDAIKKATE